MRVRAVANTGAALPDSALREGHVYSEQLFMLTLGREYVVYAMTVDSGHPWFYIVDDDLHPWPMWHPGPLFELVDGRVSRYWVFGYAPRDDDAQGRAVPNAEFAFPEWIREPMFLDRLTDNEQPEVSVFARYKSLMDDEFDRTAS